MISVNVYVNTSPLAGKEGSKISSTALKDRLKREAENDVSLRVKFDDKGGNEKGIEIQGRGDLHLGVLFEKLRREGYEMALTPPVVVFKKEGATTLEPVEKVTVEVAELHTPLVIEKMNYRSADFLDCVTLDNGRQKYLVFTVNIN